MPASPPAPQASPGVDAFETANADSLAYVESLYEQYLDDPAAVPDAWRDRFASLNGAAARQGNGHGPSHPASTKGFRTTPRFTPPGLFGSASPPPAQGDGHADPNHGSPLPGAIAVGELTDASLQHRVDMLIRNYRVRGHIIAQLDPLGTRETPPPELDPDFYGFSEADYDRPFFYSTSLDGRGRTQTLRQIIDSMRSTYCGDIGVQFMHIDNLAVRQWLQERMEGSGNRVELSRKEQVRILTRLTDAVVFEEFIQRKFIGAKSFSLEGAESLIPLLDLAFERTGDQGVQEIVIGMAHRGRLNVLANILGKSPQKIFREFEDMDPELYLGGGDVKYHLGYSGDWRTRSGRNIHLSLCFNPSHLEFVNPVAMGRLRAKQDATGRDSRGEGGMCLLIHGDAAFAGEGIVQETLNMSSLPGYTVGGTLHIIINNQIGFTTGPKEARSTRYATDVARMLQSPIFHVNGERPEAVAAVVNLATDFRAAFNRDVFIDMYCFRKRGHNEGDEPSYTQPRMYATIDSRKGVRESYLDHLMKLGGVTREDADRIADRRTQLLERELDAARSDHFAPQPAPEGSGQWKPYVGGPEAEVEEIDTGVDAGRLRELLESQLRTPEGFHLHPKLQRLMKLKAEMARGERPLDWAAAEALAFASIVSDGHRIRLTGQDSQRGTFSHRHAVLHDVEDGKTYTPLQHIDENQAAFEVYNSPLSENGPLGFEYGYSLDMPATLVMWEAQFGDFVNVAQPIIDQFITSAEDKWRRLSGLVMLLPHGFEGQGPEHSSARLERFLNQCAEDNIQVCQPTTPAQHFHLLRRQVLRRWRKPLVVMTPKSLLRHPRCVSSLHDLTHGSYQRVIGDDAVDAKNVERVLLCSGRVYYDLIERRQKLGRGDVAIVRLEEFYPFPVQPLRAALERYGKRPVVWVQDEPVNMGAWHFLKGGYGHRLLHHWPMTRVARPSSASPATGSKAAHAIEQERLLTAAFGDEPLQRLRKYHDRECDEE